LPPTVPGGVTKALLVDDSTSATPALTIALYPTTGPLSIIFNNPITETQITVTDNLGRQLYSTTTGGGTISLDMRSFAEGM